MGSFFVVAVVAVVAVVDVVAVAGDFLNISPPPPPPPPPPLLLLLLLLLLQFRLETFEKVAAGESGVVATLSMKRLTRFAFHLSGFGPIGSAGSVTSLAPPPVTHDIQPSAHDG